MNLNQLYYFKQLAKDQHYTKASQKLYISQPSLSHAIKELEKELGVALFYKKGRNVFLSEEGRIFLDYVNRSLQILQEGKQHLKDLHKSKNKIIEVSVIPTIVNTYFAPILQALNTRYPHLQIRFKSEQTATIIAGIQNKTYDFGICSKISDTNLVFLPLLCEELVLIIPKKHPLSSMQKITLEQIAKYPFITYSKNVPLYNLIIDIFKRNNVKPQITYQLDDETSIASMVSLNFGIAIVAKNDLLIPFDNIDIIHLPLKYDTRLIYLVYNPQKKLTDEAHFFIDYLINEHLKI